MCRDEIPNTPPRADRHPAGALCVRAWCQASHVHALNQQDRLLLALGSACRSATNGYQRDSRIIFFLCVLGTRQGKPDCLPGGPSLYLNGQKALANVVCGHHHTAALHRNILCTALLCVQLSMGFQHHLSASAT